MGISIDQIKDPRQRARYEEALRSGAGGKVHQRAEDYCSHQMLRDQCTICKAFGAGISSPKGSPGRPPLVSHEPRPTRLISQSHKPVLNGLETAALAWIQVVWPSYVFHKQALRFKLANGSWYKPDLAFFADGGRLTCYEAKELRGKNATRGILALKCAAYQFPEVRWHLLVRQKGVWREQEVLP